MISPGALLLKFRQTFEHGFRTTYYRDIVRPKILNTLPIVANDASCCEIHVLTSAQDWLNLIWGLKSLYYYSQRSYALCIHADTSLSQEHQAILQAHFPEAHIIDRSQADAEVLDWLAPYPRCQEFRRNNHLAPKVFDFLYYLQSDRLFLFDSDILFFREPTHLLRCLENPNYTLNTVNRDVSSAYTVDPEKVREIFQFNLISQFNSGLGLIHKASLKLEWLEEFLALPAIVGHFWRIEQTLFALCSSRFGVELLPAEYDVRLDRGLGNCPSRHYVGCIRPLLYREGIAMLVQQKFLNPLSSKS